MRCEQPKGWQQVRCPHGNMAYKPLRCRKCEGCLDARRRRLVERIRWGMDRANWCALMTLTTPNQGERPEWGTVMRRFQSLVKAIRKREPGIEYCAVKEEGEGGMRHLHVVLTGCRWLSRDWLSQAWEDRIGAWSVDIRRIGRAAGGYVAKYLGKGHTVGKTVTFSKGFPKEPPRESIHEMVGTPVDPAWPWEYDDVAVLTDTGYVVSEDSYRNGPCWCFGAPEAAKERMHEIRLEKSRHPC